MTDYFSSKIPALLFSIFVSNSALAKLVVLDNKPVESISQALQNAKNGSVIKIGAGEYQDGGVLKADNVTINAEDGVHLKNFSTKGKAALVIQGNNTEIINIECSGIKVRHGNGACIRLEGNNISLRNVYFHDSQQGLLCGKNCGKVFIEDSTFERLGHVGQAHGIYVGSGELYIHNSKFLSSKSEGHEIKSRATKTVISNSTIASLKGKDSRLVDVPNGGELSITNSVLQQGNNTSNWNLIGYGLEGIKHQSNKVKIDKNIFILDRARGSLIFHERNSVKKQLTNNVIVGKYNDKGLEADNIVFKTRKEAGFSPFPFLPER